MNSPVLRKLATALVAVLLLFYIGYQLYNANYASVQTEVAEYVSADDPGTADVVQVEGLVLRKEKVLTQEVDGVVAYVVEDGGRIQKDGTVGEIFSSQSDAAAQQQIEALDEQIADLERLGSSGNVHNSDQESLKNQTQLKLADVLKESLGGNFSSMQESREELLYTMNERQIVIGEAQGFEGRIEELKAKRESLAASGKSVGKIDSPEAGTFISQVDGYETVYSYEDVKDITPEKFEQMKAEEPVETPNAVGKICGEYNWYFVCSLDPDDALKFLQGTSVTLNFPFVTTQEIPATVAAVNQPDRQGPAVIVFESSRMGPELASLRRETCQISAERYSGIRVSQKAIHFETITKTVKGEDGKEKTITKEVKGVYVLHGTEIRFRQIIPLFSTSSYVICKQYPDESDDLMTDETVQMYDEVVIEGTDLYDGKVVK